MSEQRGEEALKGPARDQLRRRSQQEKGLSPQARAALCASLSGSSPTTGTTKNGMPAHLSGAIKSVWDRLFPSSILDFRGPIETVSNLPGRVRFRTETLIGNEQAEAATVENLPKIPGVQSVQVNVTSGSVLILYDPEELSPELLLTAMLKLLGLEEEFLRTPEPAVARELRNIGESLNRTVYEVTGGLVDLRTAILITLAAGGMYKLGRDSLRAFPAGFTLLWWAYTSLLRGK